MYVIKYGWLVKCLIGELVFKNILISWKDMFKLRKICLGGFEVLYLG